MSTKLNLEKLAVAVGGTVVVASRASAAKRLKLGNAFNAAFKAAKTDEERTDLINGYVAKLRSSMPKVDPKIEAGVKRYLKALMTGEID